MKMVRKDILEEVSSALKQDDSVIHARIYGSWMYNEKSVDMDIAVMIKSEFGVIDARYYRTLYELRKMLCEKTGQDIDLVPHTEDEFTDRNSPLWYPRYNPSLVFGHNLKGDFRVLPISKSADSFTFADLTSYVLHDNRTICRRQLVRSFNGEEGRIFVSKLLHGPGNALTYHACKNNIDYTIPPSDLDGCFERFDELYRVSSLPAIGFLRHCKKSLDREMGIMLMNWYENLVNMVIHGDQFKPNYQHICIQLSKKT